MLQPSSSCVVRSEFIIYVYGLFFPHRESPRKRTGSTQCSDRSSLSSSSSSPLWGTGCRKGKTRQKQSVSPRETAARTVISFLNLYACSKRLYGLYLPPSRCPARTLLFYFFISYSLIPIIFCNIVVVCRFFTYRHVYVYVCMYYEYTLVSRRIRYVPRCAHTHTYSGVVNLKTKHIKHAVAGRRYSRARCRSDGEINFLNFSVIYS